MYKISEKLLGTMLEYLSTRPIREADILFHELSRLEKIEEKEEKKVERVDDIAAKVSKK